ncbi:hypothetical protein AKJ09_04438 [Labilithrix luteola]|uniref:HTH luxR-type domain-containing protein n=1 Tax=Labilithrix luteola TaxID=1391654 RepID=A0A0K1PXC0_9BACT|nr:LuxR C-terminal-related transcriptional regulator [Labilithrix luteola]AKU97774.1 hypothetical protein AKJ09_04438 [Labilithrix luteola]
MSSNGRRVILDRRPDLVSVLEAAYGHEKDEEAWAGQLVDAIQRALPRSNGVGFNLFEYDENLAITRLRHVAAVGSGIAGKSVSGSVFRAAGPEVARRYHFPRRLVTTQSEIDDAGSDEVREFGEFFRRRVGMADGVAMIGRSNDGIGFVLYAGFDERIELGRYERQALARVALHLESAIRLRLRPERAVAVMDANGKLLHCTEEALDRDALAKHVVAVEASHLRGARRGAEGIATWNALLDGRLSLVARDIGGKRHYVLLENAPDRRAMRVLSRQEVEILHLSARGMPVKLVSYALGIASSTISHALASAANKLGLQSPRELLRLASNFVPESAGELDLGSLTSAERDVLELIRQGLSNQQIADARRSSARTVANQVNAILRKTNVLSRRALIAAAMPST